MNNKNRSTALALALLGLSMALVVVTASLSVWRDGEDRWLQIAAAVALVATVVAVGVLLSTAQGWVNGSRVSLAAVATGVVGAGALALVVATYAGAGDSPAPVVVTAEGAALSEQQSNNAVQPPGYAHDVGEHPAFNDFVEMDEATLLRNVPGGTLLPGEAGLLRDELVAARAFAEQHKTVEQAQAAGFYNTTNDVPFMGAHFLNREYLTDGVFDAGKPEGLLFSKLGGGEEAEWQLVGVWYLLIPGLTRSVTTTTPPPGFAGNLDLWHAHHGLCTADGAISENNTAEGCASRNGNFIGDIRWMMHVWVWPEGADNPEGVFTYLNANLYEMQQAEVQAAP